MRTKLQYLENVVLTNPSTDYRLQNGIPNDYAMTEIVIDLSLRDVVAVAGLGVIPFGSPSTFIERITLQGQLLGKGFVTLFDMTGRQAFQFARFFYANAGFVDPDNLVVGAGAVGTYDIRVQYRIPLTGSFGPAGRMASMLPGNMFANPLILTIRRGNATSLGLNAGGSTQTFSAYGVGTGSPSVEVHRVIVEQGLSRQARVPILVTKTAQGPFTLTATLTDGQIGRLNTGRLIGKLWFQTGVQDLTNTNELASVTNAAITRLRLKQNTTTFYDALYRSLHYWANARRGLLMGAEELLTLQGPAAQTGGFNRWERVGEAWIDFVPEGNIDDALVTNLWQSQGQNLFLYGDVTGVANQQVEVISEEYERLGG